MNWDSSERRKFVRIKFLCEIAVYTLSRKKMLSINTENISAGGIRVFLKERLSSGKIIELKIHGIGKAPIACKAKIIWAFPREMPQYKKNTVYDTGMEFYQLSKKDLNKIKKIIAANLKNQRA